MRRNIVKTSDDGNVCFDPRRDSRNIARFPRAYFKNKPFWIMFARYNEDNSSQDITTPSKRVRPRIFTPKYGEGYSYLAIKTFCIFTHNEHLFNDRKNC